MKKALLFLALLLVLAVCEWQEAQSKCCPPPPATTGPARTLPRSQRTSPPASGITLPPQTSMPQTTMTAPGQTTGGPVTATGPATGTRTGVTGVPTGTSNITNQPNTSAGGNTRPGNNTPQPSQGGQTPGASGGAPSTMAPLPSLPGQGNNSPIIVHQFGWEDWWSQNTSGFLTSYEAVKTEDYVKTNLTIADVPRLITLYAYRGLFEDGITEIATMNLQGIGGAEELVGQIALGKYSYKKGDTAPSIGNKKDYEYLAVRALGFMGGTKAKETIAAVLMRDMIHIPDQAVGAAAENALAEVINKDRDVNKRFWACIALGQLKDPKYISVLTNVAKSDGNVFVRTAASEGIAMIGGSAARKGLEESIDGARYYQAKAYAAASLGFLGASEPLEEIRASLKAKNGEVRVAAAFALAYIISLRLADGKEYEELLGEYLLALKSEADDAIRPSIGMGMFLFASPVVLKEIQPYLTYQLDPHVRSITSLVFGMSGTPEAAEVLTALPIDKDPSVEAARAYAVGMLSSGGHAKLATDMLEIEKNDTLLAAGIMISSMVSGDANYKRIYELRLHKGDAIVARAVTFGLAAYHGATAKTFTAGAVRSNDAEKRSLAMVGIAMRNDADALDMLSAHASTRSLDVKLVYDVSMGLMGGLPLVAKLREVLKDGMMQVRAAASVALGSLNRPEQIDTLLEIITKDKDDRTRAYAIAGLLGIRVPKADEAKVIAALIKVLKEDRYYTPRAFAAIVLSKFKDSREAYDGVRLAIDDKENDVKAMAAISLGIFGNPSGAKEIKTVMAQGRGTPLAYSGLIGLGLLGDDSNLDKMITDFEFISQGEEFEAMAFAISRCAKKDTYAQMLKYLENPDVYLREYTVKTFAMMDNLDDDARKEVREKLVPLAKDDDMQVRFFSGITRYALGDKEGLKLVLDTITDNSYYMADRVGVDYRSLQKLINTSLPAYYRIPPYFWEETE